MRVRVDQSGHQGAPAAADDRGVRRINGIGRNRLDQIAFDQNIRVFDPCLVPVIKDMDILPRQISVTAL